MPRLGLGMPIVSGASNAPVTVIDDVLWEDFGDSGGEIAVNYQETRTNSVLHSQDVTDAEAWTKGNTAIDSTLYEAPDNSTTANAIKSNSTGEKVYNINQTVSVTAGKTYTLSAHVKKQNLGFAQLRFSDGDGLPRAQFNLTTGAITNASNTIRNQVDAMDNDWFRCSITFVATTSSGSGMVMAQSAAGDGTPNVAVSGIVLIYVWGFQLEESIEATSYIVTTTEARTRTTTLNDTSDVWDFDSANLMPEADPDSEGVWEVPANIVLNGDYEELGSEIVTNGTFDADSDWSGTGSNGYSISSGKLNLSNTPYATNVTQANVTTIGKIYKVTFEISNYVKGSVRIFLGGDVTSSVNSDGTYTFYVTASANTSAGIQAFSGSGTTLSIDNVSVKQVDPNNRWTLGTNVSISDGKLNWANSPNNNGGTQSSSLTQGTAYEITFTVSDYSSGSVRIRFPFVGTRRTANGTYTQIGVADQSTSDIFIQGEESGGNTATLSVDNVTIREYAIQPQDV